MLGTRGARIGLMVVCLWAVSGSSVGHGGAQQDADRAERSERQLLDAAESAPSTTTSTSTTTTTTVGPTAPAPAPVPAPVPVPPTSPAAPPVAGPVEDDPVPRRASAQRSTRAPEVAGRIIVPKLGLDVDYYEGGELAQIDFGPSHMPHTALPGYKGNTVFAGHRVTYTHPFRHLDKLVRGDTVTFVAPWGTFTYAFTHHEVVPEGGTQILLQTPDPTATLFACHPPGSSEYRIVARFDLVSAPARGEPEGPHATPLYDEVPSDDSRPSPTPSPTPTTAPPSTTSTSLVLPGRK